MILGPRADWRSAPLTLTLDGTTEYAVVYETQFLVRGVAALADGSTDATVTCEDGTVVACVLNVTTVH